MICEKCGSEMEYIDDWHLGSLGDFKMYGCNDCGHIDKEKILVDGEQ